MGYQQTEVHTQPVQASTPMEADTMVILQVLITQMEIHTILVAYLHHLWERNRRDIENPLEVVYGDEHNELCLAEVLETHWEDTRCFIGMLFSSYLSKGLHALRIDSGAFLS